jgi:hypothetical protein
MPFFLGYPPAQPGIQSHSPVREESQASGFFYLKLGATFSLSAFSYALKPLMAIPGQFAAPARAAKLEERYVRPIHKNSIGIRLRIQA